MQRIRGCNRKLTDEVKELDSRIRQVPSPYTTVIERLCKMPGVQNRTCEDLIAEIGPDMSKVHSSAQLCSWAAMCPGNNESAGKKKSSRTNHGDKHLKATLVEAAWAASRTKGTFLAERFSRLAAKQGSKRALIVVGHSILTSIYYVLATGQEYRELGYNHVPEKVEKRRKDYLKAELKKLGYDVKSTKKPPCDEG